MKYIVKEKKKIDKKEQNALFKQKQNGDKEARDNLIISNINLVHFRLNTRFEELDSKEDLLQVGIIGLIKAVDKYDLSKKTEFSTFAVTCIDNAILLELRKTKNERKEKITSIDKPIMCDTPNRMKELDVKETIESNVNIEEEYLKKELTQELWKVIENLSEKEKYIILNYYGFYEVKLTQKDLAKKLGTDQPYLSKKISRVNKKIKKQLIKYNK